MFAPVDYQSACIWCHSRAPRNGWCVSQLVGQQHSIYCAQGSEKRWRSQKTASSALFSFFLFHLCARTHTNHDWQTKQHNFRHFCLFDQGNFAIYASVASALVQHPSQNQLALLKAREPLECQAIASVCLKQDTLLISQHPYNVSCQKWDLVCCHDNPAHHARREGVITLLLFRNHFSSPIQSHESQNWFQNEAWHQNSTGTGTFKKGCRKIYKREVMS